MKVFVFEGMDGSGKTTTVEAVATELQNLGFKVKTVCWLYDGVARDTAIDKIIAMITPSFFNKAI